MFAPNNFADARLMKTVALTMSQSLAASRKVVTEQVIVDGLSKYCQHRPFPKQLEAMLLPDLEVLFGGEAGSGKTDWLAMCALQHVHIPGYNALILRRNVTRMRGGNSVLDRMRFWLKDSDANWDGKLNGFVFPSGAQIKFGYLDNPEDRHFYLGHGYQFLGWEELTDFHLAEEEWDPYLYMFRCLRSLKNANIPLRVRATTNPGGKSHYYVKSRYISEEAMDAIDRGEHDTWRSMFMPERPTTKSSTSRVTRKA